MPHKGSINEELTSRDIPRYKSELEDIDFAVYKFIDERLDIQTKTNKGFKKVPVVWSGADRAHNIKDDEINRNLQGMITLPVISLERKSMVKDEESRTIPYAKIDPYGDIKGGYLTINRVIKQDKTRNFARADSFRRRGQNNFPIYKNKKNEKIVYETLTIPIPIYVNIGYEVALRTEYQEQMNDILTPFIRISNGHRRVYVENNGMAYEAFIDKTYTMTNNISAYENKERKYETTIKMNVYGHLIGDGKNQEQPRVVRRENAVQIRFARERIITQDEDGEFRF